jgi:hypothetical protein
MNSGQESTIRLPEILRADSLHEDQLGNRVSEFTAALESEIEKTIEYLGSSAASDSITLDPYWPKWDSPWWHMTLLHELGLANRIPNIGLQSFLKGIDGYLHFFPLTEDDLPAGRDPLADVLCHCALATADRVLRAAQVDVDGQLPWIGDWFIRYQLPDGGYNCDESVYTNSRKSSMISTVHMIEAMLDRLEHGVLEETQLECLDRAAQYVIERRLLRSISKNFELMDPLWCQLTFPRFYELDILRTIKCLVSWSVARNKPVPWNSLEEVVGLLDAKIKADKKLKVERDFYKSCGTRLPKEDGTWLSKQPVSVFPLLLKVSTLGHSDCPVLTASWKETLALLMRASGNGLVCEDNAPP